jgi:hypothetical protein
MVNSDETKAQQTEPPPPQVQPYDYWTDHPGDYELTGLSAPMAPNCIIDGDQVIIETDHNAQPVVKSSHSMSETIDHLDTSPAVESTATDTLDLGQTYLDQAQNIVQQTQQLLDLLRLLPNKDAPELLAQLFHQLGENAEAAARGVCINAIEQQIMTRKRASEIFGVHQMTVGRWVTAHQAEQQQ